MPRAAAKAGSVSVSRREVLGGLAAVLAFRELKASARTADVAYVNARLWTGRPGADRATAFATIGNRIAAVGDDARIRSFAGRRTRVVDLGGAWVSPGFIDNHTHFLRAGLALRALNLESVTSRDAFVRNVADAARALPPGTWLHGANWDENRWNGELPTRHWIDAVTPQTPVALVRQDLHVVLLNSVALRLAGIDRNTPDPEGGQIVRDASGEPNGLLKEKAGTLYRSAVPPDTDAQIDAAILVGIEHAVAHGVTQVHIPELDWTTHAALRRLRARGEPAMRFYSFVPIEDWQRLDALVKAEGRGDDWVRWGGVKGLIDGSLGSRTALLHEPYADDPQNQGLRRSSRDGMLQKVTAADAAGLQVTVHAIGDAANAEILDIYAKVAAANGRRDRRFRVEHAQHLQREDIRRFAELNVIASMQPYHAVDDSRWARKALGPRRLHGSWALRDLLDAGVRVTLGSDWPVAPLDPLSGLEAAVLRRTIDGSHPAGWVPEQRITVIEALCAYTAANAYAGFQEDRLGVIAEGYLADVVVLDTDLTRCAPQEISRARVLRTLVGGRDVYTASLER